MIFLKSRSLMGESECIRTEEAQIIRKAKKSSCKSINNDEQQQWTVVGDPSAVRLSNYLTNKTDANIS
jgi:hypothetical protein